MTNGIWLSVSEYAKEVKKTRQTIYLNIRLGKIKKEKVRKQKVEKIIYQIFLEK